MGFIDRDRNLILDIDEVASFLLAYLLGSDFTTRDGQHEL